MIDNTVMMTIITEVDTHCIACLDLQKQFAICKNTRTSIYLYLYEVEFKSMGNHLFGLVAKR